jgi:hypothetical protein
MIKETHALQVPKLEDGARGQESLVLVLRSWNYTPEVLWAASDLKTIHFAAMGGLKKHESDYFTTRSVRTHLACTNISRLRASAFVHVHGGFHSRRRQFGRMDSTNAHQYINNARRHTSCGLPRG